jgi:hypothetical protein
MHRCRWTVNATDIEAGLCFALLSLPRFKRVRTSASLDQMFTYDLPIDVVSLPQPFQSHSCWYTLTYQFSIDYKRKWKREQCRFREHRRHHHRSFILICAYCWYVRMQSCLNAAADYPEQKQLTPSALGTSSCHASYPSKPKQFTTTP